MSFKKYNRQLFSFIVMFSLLTLFVNVSFAAVGANWIEQWGIRWTFDKNISTNGATGTYRYGTFANGDYWIVGPVKIIGINPPSHITTAGERDADGNTHPTGITINGSMVNIAPGEAHGYQSEIGGWDPALNAAWGVSAGSPLALSTGSSLVSTESKVWITGGDQARVMRASVLTVLASVPAENSFRPPYCGTDKTIEFNKSDLDYSKLKSLNPVADMPTLATLEDNFKRVWIDHKQSYGGRFTHPHKNMPDYGAEMTVVIGDAALLLNLKHDDNAITNNTMKETLLVEFVQYGIDLWGVYESGGLDIWEALGGHGQGRKLPILMAGVILGDSDMSNIGKHNIEDPFFGEDQVTYYLYPEEVNRWIGSDGKYPTTNLERNDPGAYYISSDYESIDLRNKGVMNWGTGNDYTQNDVILDDSVYYVCKGRHTSSSTTKPGSGADWKNYWRSLASYYLGIPEFGKTYEGGAPLGVFQGRWISRTADASYRQNHYWPMDSSVLAAHIMGLKDKWNHDALFDYTDRYVGWLGGQSGFTKNMWDTYRADYGPIWPNTGQTPATYTLSVTATNGSVAKSPNKTAYNSGEIVTLTATPSAGYTFTGWSGSASGTANPVTITMNSNKTVTANFTQISTTYTLSVTATNGSVAKSPNKTAYNSGEIVTLTATPSAGYTFTGWSGGVSGTTNPVTITMNSNKTVTANFEAVVPDDPDPVSVMESEIGFDKVNDYKEMSLSNASAASGTIGLWVYGYDYDTSAYLFGHTIGSWSNRIQLYVRASYLGLGLGDTNARHTNIQLLEPNRWYFLTLAWNGTTYTVYVDGQQKATGTYTGLTALNTFADIGNTGNPDWRTNEVFHGRIDDVKIYDTAIAGTGVAQLYTEGRNGGLAGYLKMDDTFDNANPAVITDDSGKNMEPVAVNSPQPASAWAQEYSLQFGGTDQAVQVSCDSMRTEAGTIAMKVSPSSATDTAYLFGHSLNSTQMIYLYTVAGKLALGLGNELIVDSDIATLSAGTMYHVALTWNGTNYAVYVDGQEASSGTFSGLTALAATADIANMGTVTSRSQGLGFDGSVGDVQIYSRTLSAQEITALFNTQDTKENRMLTFFISGQDQNGNPYTYTAQNLPAGAAFDQAAQKLTWRPWYDQAGDHQVLFTSLNGADQQSVTLSVKDVTLKDWYRDFLAQNGKL